MNHTDTKDDEKTLQKKREEEVKKRTHREGKTAKDRANGEQARRRSNIQERDAWNKDNKNTKFPAHTCNGKKNRYRVTGKDGNSVILRN